jgi:flagellin
MSLFINTNVAASNAANNLSFSNVQLQNSLNKLSSGSRIVRASDDAGGLAASMDLTSAAANAGSSVSSDANQISFLQAQDGVLKVAGDIATRLAQLTSLQSDPTLSSTDKAGYTTETTKLNSELGTLSAMTFNGTVMFGSGAPSFATSGALSSSSTVATIASARATNGAAQSSLLYDSQAQSVAKTNLEAAAGQIANVDVASEATNLAKWNVMVQYGAAMLAQANQSTQVALKLIQ